MPDGSQLRVHIHLHKLSPRAHEWLERKTAERVEAILAAGGSFLNRPEPQARAAVVVDLVEAAARTARRPGGED